MPKKRMQIQPLTSAIPLSHPLNLNKTRTEDGRLGDSISSRERAGAVSNSSDGKAVHLELCEGEVGGEGDGITTNANALERLNDGQVLLVDVDKGELGPVRGAGVRGGEAELDARGSSAGCAEHVEGLEGLERDGVDVGAGAGNHEALDSGEGKVAHASGQEGQRVGALVLENVVEALLFTLLPNY